MLKNYFKRLTVWVEQSNIYKVEKIKNYADLEKLWKDDSLKNPCRENQIVFNQ